ncbi:MAG TPA: thioredoxin [Anaerolineales bacterium]|nr:thioredoxin [Anaerolineales bacterium]
MMASDHIIDVSEADFEYQVIAYSQKIPVVVDFWAEWCIPCRTLGPLLELIASEAQGTFRLAKVNVDQNQNLAMRYNIRSIPAVKAFRDGHVVSEFVGLQPEPRVREFIRTIAPSQSDLDLEKAQSLYRLQNYAEAEGSFRRALRDKPASPIAQLGLAKSLLMQGQPAEAAAILRSFPTSQEYSIAMGLLPVAESMLHLGSGNAFDDNPLEAAYARAIKLAQRGNLPAALDGILDILRQDKRYRHDEVRLVFLGLLELLGEDSYLTRQYRQELASVLF